MAKLAKRKLRSQGPPSPPLQEEPAAAVVGVEEDGPIPDVIVAGNDSDSEAESDDDVVESEDEDGVTVADGSEEDEADSDYDGEDESDGLVCSLSSFEWNFS